MIIVSTRNGEHGSLYLELWLVFEMALSIVFGHDFIAAFLYSVQWNQNTFISATVHECTRERTPSNVTKNKRIETIPISTLTVM